jgi:ribonuclease HI
MSFYAVSKGKNVGIYDSWDECKNNTKGYKGAIFKKFTTKEDADRFILENTDTEIENVNTSIKKTKTPSFYAAVNGKNVGIYDSWDECKKIKGSTFKKFKTKEEAEKYILENTITKIGNSIFEPDYYVYTDGACSNNGKENALAGIGIYFGENDIRNVSQKVIGKQSNNTAELFAIFHLYDIIKNDILSGKKIGIVSDSEYAIKSATTYGKKNDEKGWKKDIPNKDLVKKIFELYNNKPNIKFFHISAHTEKEDVHSLGNDGADKLANKAIGLDTCPYSTKKKKIYLVVPFDKKDIVKELDGRFDALKKLWYIFDDSINKEKVLSLFKMKESNI